MHTYVYIYTYIYTCVYIYIHIFCHIRTLLSIMVRTDRITFQKSNVDSEISFISLLPLSCMFHGSELLLQQVLGNGWFATFTHGSGGNCQPIRSCYLMTPFCVTYKASKQMCCLMPWKNGGFVFEGFLYPYVWLMLQKEDMTCQKRKADGTITSIWGLFCSCVAVCDRFHCPVHECKDGNVFIDTDSHAKHAQVRQNRSPEVQCEWHHFHFFGFVVSIQTVHKVFFHQEKLPLWLLLIRFFQRLSC